MNTDRFFKGTTEQYLLGKLKEDKILTFQTVVGAYSSPENAKSFMQKLIHFEVGKLTGAGIITLVEEETKKESGKKEEEKENEIVSPSETQG